MKLKKIINPDGKDYLRREPEKMGFFEKQGRMADLTLQALKKGEIPFSFSKEELKPNWKKKYK